MDHLRVNHDSDEERCSLHSAFERDPLQGYEVFICTPGSAIPEVQYVRSDWFSNALQPEGERDLSIICERSVLIYCLRSLPTQRSPVNCWRRSPTISPKSSSPVIMTTIFSFLFSALLSFFLASPGTKTNVFTCAQQIWMPLRMIRYHVVTLGYAPPAHRSHYRNKRPQAANLKRPRSGFCGVFRVRAFDIRCQILA